MILICFLLLFSTCTIESQNILKVMLNDSRITQFARYINVSTTLFGYFSNPALTIFVPSDVAVNATVFTNLNQDSIYKSHMFESINPVTAAIVSGITTNWNNYKLSNYGSNIYYTMTTMGGTNRLFMYGSASTSFFCNDGLLIAQNMTSGSQVYHIIDRVFVNYQMSGFKLYLASNPLLSTTLSYWNLLDNAASNYQIPNSLYHSLYLTPDALYPYTMLVPTNDAWTATNPNNVLNLSGNITLLYSILSRHYIPDAILFLRGFDVTFNGTFNASRRQTPPGIATPGILTADLQVSIQSYSAKITKANIPITFGVVHIIDNPLVSPPSLTLYLQNVGLTVFLSNLQSLNLTEYLKGGYSIIAPDDVTLARITNATTMKSVLLNSFIPGYVRLTVSNTPIQTVGNTFIRLRMINNVYYIDTLLSATDNTWIHTSPVQLLNQLVGAIVVTKLNGSISQSAMSCDTMLKYLNSSMYQSLKVSNGITLNIGSPYTLLVPLDNALINFLYQYNLNGSTTSSIMKYTLQRMIIANRLNLFTKGVGTFRAATMNFAAMQEWLTFNIATPPYAMISLYGGQVDFNYSAGGYYCYSNTRNDSSRFNLIYSVPDVLPTLAGVLINNICVSAPCASTQIIIDTFLVIFSACLLVFHRQLAVL